MEHGKHGLTAYAGDLLPSMEGEWLDQLRAELRTACVQLCDAVTWPHGSWTGPTWPSTRYAGASG